MADGVTRGDESGDDDDVVLRCVSVVAGAERPSICLSIIVDVDAELPDARSGVGMVAVEGEPCWRAAGALPPWPALSRDIRSDMVSVGSCVCAAGRSIEVGLEC